MEGQPLHLLAQPHHPRLIPNHPTHYLPTSRLRVHRRKPKQLAAVPSRRPSGSQADAPGRSGWERVPNAVAALVFQLTVSSLLFLFPNRARVLALPPSPGAAAVVETMKEEEDKEWEAALQKWKTKTYALSVPLRVIALRGSFPPSWIKDLVEVQGKRLKFSPELRANLDGIFSEMSQCMDKGQVQPKSAMAADVVSLGDSWLSFLLL